MNMRSTKIKFVASIAIGSAVVTGTWADEHKLQPQTSAVTGAHDFDFEFGNWRVHHRVKRPTGEWIEFEGTSSDRALNDGSANVEENTFHRPTGDTQGIALRAFDKKTGLWAIWWVDSRNPHAALDPPVKGKFVDGVGTFVADGVVNGKMQRTRFVWSHITPTSAQWEQSFSQDHGKIWDSNWVMEFTRQP
ncbi:MAG: hypothetical protein ABJB01_05920 [Rudaea sp.]